MHKPGIKRIALALGVVFLAVAAPMPAHASVMSLFGGVLAVAIGWPIFILNYIIASIFGLGISIIAYFIGVVLQLNMNIAGSNIVSSGFTVTLALANLGFVLSIIIIAIATIIRYETYALKQTLWKLVAAAILVNFSLVISGAILNFSNQLSFYFLESINPAGGGSSFENFSSVLAGSFGPQKVFLAGTAGSSFSTAAGGNTAAADAFSDSGQKFGSILAQIMNIFFPTIFLIITVIALGGLFIMLLIRYIYIGILLILMPMAWLLWIFPATVSQWHKWWSKFIQWTMFAPIVLFFLWLAILTMGANTDGSLQGIPFKSDSPVVASISNFTGGILSGMLGPLLQMAMMVAMLFAGLFMAQSMGVTFADTTIKGASAVTSGFGKWSGRVGTRVGTLPFRTQAARKAAGALQQTRIGAGGGGLARAAGAVANYGLGWAGRGVENLAVAGGEKLTSEYAGEVKQLTKDQTINQLSSSNAPRRHALLQRIKEQKWDTDPEDIGKIQPYLTGDREAEFKRYGNGKFYNDERRDTGIELMEKVGKKELETAEQIKEYFEGLPNPGVLAQVYFQKFKQDKNGRDIIPLGMSADDYNNVQKTIARGATSGLTSNNLSEFFKNLSRGNQVGQFEKVALSIKLTESDISDANQRWLNTSSGAHNLGIGIETFTGKKKEESKIEIPESTGGTPRSRTIFPPTPPPKP